MATRNNCHVEERNISSAGRLCLENAGFARPTVLASAVATIQTDELAGEE